MKDFLMREIIIKKGKTTARRMRSSLGASISVSFINESRMPHEQTIRFTQGTYEADARELADALNEIADNACLLPEIKETP